MKKKTFRNILTIFLLILILILVFGLISHFVTGNKTDNPSENEGEITTPDKDKDKPSNPPVVDEGKVMLAINGNVLTSGQFVGLSYGVNYFVVKNAKAYTASVCFVDGIEDFDVRVDGVSKSFSEKELKTAFKVISTDTGFSIDIPADLYTMLSRVYEGKEIVFPSSLDYSEMFCLKVLADDVSYEIPFKITTIFNILLDIERIVL